MQDPPAGDPVKFIVLAAFAAIPLQWFLLGETALGDIRIHQLAVVFLTFVIVFKYGLPWIERHVRGAQVFIAANLYMIILWVALNVFNGLGMSQPIKQVAFLAGFIAVSALFHQIVQTGETGLVDAMRWSAAAAVTVLLMAFGVSMLSNGVNPIDVVTRAIEAGDPDILQKELFRSSFSGFGYDANQEAIGNLRHEVFGGLLFTMYVAAWATARRPFTVPRQRNVYRGFLIVGSLLLLISLSRSVLVAAAIWPLLSLVRALLTGRVSPRQQVAVVAGVFTAAIMAMTGFLSLLWTRFTEETESYSVRESLISLAFQRIQDNFWTGGIETEGSSSHNFVLDMWQRGGIFVGLPAVFIFVFMSLLWLQQLLRITTVSDELFVLTAAMALPCVRLVTQGGGSLQVVEWMTMALVIGVLAASRDLAKAPPEAEPTDEMLAVTHLRSTQAPTLQRLLSARSRPG